MNTIRDFTSNATRFHADGDVSVTVNDDGIVISNPNGAVSLGASAAIRIASAVDKHRDALIDASRNEMQADLWTLGASAAADLAGRGVDIYHLQLEWDPDYATRHAEIVVRTPDVVHKHAVGPVQTQAWGVGVLTRSEIADRVHLVSVHYPPKPTDPANVPAQVAEQETGATA